MLSLQWGRGWGFELCTVVTAIGLSHLLQIFLLWPQLCPISYLWTPHGSQIPFEGVCSSIQNQVRTAQQGQQSGAEWPLPSLLHKAVFSASTPCIAPVTTGCVNNLGSASLVLFKVERTVLSVLTHTQPSQNSLNYKCITFAKSWAKTEVYQGTPSLLLLCKHLLGMGEGEQAKASTQLFLDIVARFSVELLACLLVWLFCVCLNICLSPKMIWNCKKGDSKRGYW